MTTKVFILIFFFFFFQAEDGIRDIGVTGVQTCALPICRTLRHFFPFFCLIFRNGIEPFARFTAGIPDLQYSDSNKLL